MKKLYFVAVALLVAFAAQPAFADLKLKSKQTIGGQSHENTTYIKGKRQRSETMNGMMINITQCDLRRAIQLNPATKTFVVDEWGQLEPTKPGTVPANTKTETKKGGKVVMTVNIKDTGERKQMFGYQARHLIITMTTQSSPDACSRANTKMETDGWYIDFEAGFDCDQSVNPRAYAPKASGGCQDVFELKQTGTGKRGYALIEKMTMFDESGQPSMTMLTEVLELSKATLDAGLFDIPAGYKQVSDASQMFAASPIPSVDNDRSGSLSKTSPANSSIVTAAANQPSQPAEIGTKRAGVVRIGIADVKTGAVGDSISAADLSAAVRNTFAEYLKMPDVEVVILEGKLDQAILADAKNKECDIILSVTASHKKGGGGFGGMFGKTLGVAIAQTGLGHTGSVVGNIAGQVATQAIISATSVSANVKNKDEVSIDVNAVRLGGPSIHAGKYKSKAKADGDDIISAVVEQAAKAIAAAIGK